MKMSRQRKVVITVTYNDLGTIIDTKAEELDSSAQPETCEGCKHSGQWENELEYGAFCPCLACKRRASDNYERSD